LEYRAPEVTLLVLVTMTANTYSSIFPGVVAHTVRLEKNPEEKRGAFSFRQQSAGAPTENARRYGALASETPVMEYVYIEGIPLAQINSSGAVFYIHTDLTGAPEKITDASRTLVWDQIRDPFGNVYSTPTNTTPFPGQS
jgi:hypothetical protein